MMSIGVVRNEILEPIDDIWGNVVSWIDLDASQFSADALAGLFEFSHIEVLFLLNRVTAAEVLTGARHPRGRRDNWRGVGELMLPSANKLVKSGASFLICPDNTVHRALPLIQSRSPLPWLHIAEIVATEAVECAYTSLGLLGTRWLVKSDVYEHAQLLAG
jgi:Asp/Glu/Hydantoin racemase